MQSYTNTGPTYRLWPTIVDPATSRTLELQPGEEAELDLPDDFEDPYLKLSSEEHVEDPDDSEETP